MSIAVINPRKISYQSLKSWKYRLTADYVSMIPIFPDKLVEVNYYDDPMISLDPQGMLIVRAGYCWDGASGPTIDTKNFMRGSLVHDVLCQFMRKGLLLRKDYKDKADRLLESICKEDGMSAFRAWYVYWGVRVGGGSACEPGPDPTFIEETAP